MGRKGNGRNSDEFAREDVYDLRLRKDGDGFDLISDAFGCGPIWYSGPDAVRHAVEFARFRSRRLAQEATVRVLDVNGTVVHTYKSGDEFSQ